MRTLLIVQDVSDDDLMRIFKAVDRDQSGDIDATEFTQWIHKNSVRARVSPAFVAIQKATC